MAARGERRLPGRSSSIAARTATTLNPHQAGRSGGGGGTLRTRGGGLAIAVKLADGGGTGRDNVAMPAAPLLSTTVDGEKSQGVPATLTPVQLNVTVVGKFVMGVIVREIVPV